MRIDVHTHIFPDQVVRNREHYFAGEPAFRLLYESPKARLATAETLLEAMDEDQINVAFVFGFPWESLETTRIHNDYVLEAGAKYSRLIPLACVQPTIPETLAEAERCLSAGARGLGELAIYGDCDVTEALKRYHALAQICRQYHRLLLVHANEPVGHQYPGKATMGLSFYYELAKGCSGVPLILAHWGGGLCFYELLKKETRQVLENVYYDTAASPYLYRPEIYKFMIDILGPRKILFGSDFPLLRPRRYFQELVDSRLDSDSVSAIAGGNAERLLTKLSG